MDPNTHSTPPGPRRPDGLATVAAGIDQLATEDLDRLPDAAVAEQTLALRQLLDRLDGQWLKELAGVDARGRPGPKTTWRLAPPPPGCAAACGWRPAQPRARSGPLGPCSAGPLCQTGQALCAGELSSAHAQVLAQETRHLPAQVAAQAEPTLLEIARRPAAGPTSAPAGRRAPV